MQIKISIFRIWMRRFRFAKSWSFIAVKLMTSPIFFLKKTPESISDFLKWHHDNQ